MPEFFVHITRSASHDVVLSVAAKDQDAAEKLIGSALDQQHRVGLDEITALQGVKVISDECCGDDESSWEVL